MSVELIWSGVWTISSPVSSLGAISMRLTPVVDWPLRMAKVMGSAPRHSGKRLK